MNISMLVFISIAIASVTWLFKMSDVLRSKPTSIEIEYRLDDCGFDLSKRQVIYLTADAKREDALFKVYKESEEHLRDQLNSWLTILGFFAVVLGLVVPLTSYMLQRSSLAEERERLDKDIERKIHAAVEKVRKEAKVEINRVKTIAKDAMTKAEAVSIGKTVPSTVSYSITDVRTAEMEPETSNVKKTKRESTCGTKEEEVRV